MKHFNLVFSLPFAFIILLANLGFASSFETCQSPPGETFENSKERLTKQVLLAGLRYAREHSHPVTGFVEDTVDNYDDQVHSGPIRASISSTGFLMALVADLYKKKMVSYDEAYQYCRRPLVAVLKKKKADLTAAAKRKITHEPDPHTDISYNGWFSHFIDWESGDRWIDAKTHRGVEYATTDSTWFLSGGIVCAEVFPETDIPEKFDKIFSDVNFYDFMVDGGAHPEKRTLSMAYTPEDAKALPSPKGPEKVGYSNAQWEIYQHSWLVYLLGLGTPVAKNRLPTESWAAWRRTGIMLNGHSPSGAPSGAPSGPLYGDKRALFSHYFPDVFMPPQEIKEACGIDYFKNSQTATRFNKDMALKDTSSKTFREGLWGLDAGPNPNLDNLKLSDDLVVGTDATTRYGVNTPYKRNGTSCPACVVAAAMFEPDLVFNDLRSWCDNKHFGSKLWGKYGPANGINLDYGWISPYSLSGIVGPMALSVANVDPKTSVWRFFSRYPAVKAGLKAAAAAPAPKTGCLIPE